MKNISRNVLLTAIVALTSVSAFAEEGAVVAGGISNIGLAFLGLGIAVAGAALAQGKIASASLEGIARNPQAGDKMFLPFILGLAFVESITLLAFVIALIK